MLHQGSAPLRLTAAKSRVGHTEPVAGTVGITDAASSIAYRHINHLMHLRVLNPLLSTLLNEHAADCRPVHAPRQASPHDAGTAMGQAASGVSSFAFQGTNAHAIIIKGSGQPSRQAQSSVEWRQWRFWFSSPAHPLAQTVICARHNIEMQGLLPGADACYLWDHFVHGKHLFPAAAMFEAAHAAGALLVCRDNPSRNPHAAPTATLAAASIPAPLVLPTPGQQGGAIYLTVACLGEPAAAGRLKVMSSFSGTALHSGHSVHLTGHFVHLVSMVSHASPIGLAVQSNAASAVLSITMWPELQLLHLPTATARVQQQAQLMQGCQCRIHPAVIDNVTQVASHANCAMDPGCNQTMPLPRRPDRHFQLPTRVPAIASLLHWARSTLPLGTWQTMAPVVQPAQPLMNSHRQAAWCVATSCTAMGGMLLGCK